MKNITPYLGWTGVLFFIGAAFCYRYFIESAPWSVTACLTAGVLSLLGYAVFEREAIAAAFRRRGAQGALNTGVVVAAALGILGIANYLGVQHNKRFDLTGVGVFTLAEQSRSVAKALDSDVAVLAFLRPGDMESRRQFLDLMDAYRLETARLSPTVVDPVERRDLTEKYKITEFGAVVFDKAGETRRASEVSEEAFTRALIELSTGEARVVYFLAGHGEASHESADLEGFSAAAERLASMNYRVKTLSLMRESPAVPSDAAAVIVPAPRAALLDPERVALETYVEEHGGRLFILLERSAPKAWREWLLGWGLRVRDAAVVDPAGNSLLGSYHVAVADRYSPAHPATRSFTLAALFPTAVPVEADVSLMKDSLDGQAEGLVFTHEAAWGDTDREVFRFEASTDVAGPISLAAFASFKNTSADYADDTDEKEESVKSAKSADSSEREARIVVVGDADFASNAYYHLSGNLDLFANFVNWLAEREMLLGIAPNKRAASMIQMSRTQVAVMWYTVVFGLPLAAFAAGAVVWWRRRRL